MRYQEAFDYCLAKPGAWPDEPWDGDVVVKVGDKIFAFLGSEGGDSIGLKCGKDGDEAHLWRAEYPGDVRIMAYLGRYGWNTFKLAGGYPDEDLRGAVDRSYHDVLNRMPAKRRPGPADVDPRRTRRPGGADAAAGGAGPSS